MTAPGDTPEGAPAEEDRVLGLDNVPMTLPVAGPGTRALAAFMDYLIVAVAGAVWAVVGLVLIGLRRGAAWTFAVMILGFFAIEYGYFALAEVMTGGQTFGKWVMSLRVTSRLGARAGTPSLLIRNCVRSVDLLTGVPMMALDPLARRLGDRLAGTLVLRERPPVVESVLGRVPRGWTGREISIVEDFLRRADELEPARAEHLGLRILSAIEAKDKTLLEGVDRGLGSVEAVRKALDFGLR